MSADRLSKTAQRQLAANVRAMMRVVDNFSKIDEWESAYDAITEATEHLAALSDEIYARMNEVVR